jgi:hypothetical protein
MASTGSAAVMKARMRTLRATSPASVTRSTLTIVSRGIAGLGDHVNGVQRDELGVQYVVRLRTRARS